MFANRNYKVFGDIENIFMYIDEIIIYSETLEGMNKTILEVLERIRKFKYNLTSVEYLGQIFENYLSNYVPNLAELVQPFRQLLKKTMNFGWISTRNVLMI